MQSDDKKTPFRQREEELKKKWEGVETRIPVNVGQYSYDNANREQAYLNAQFPTEEEKKRYKVYREEWYRRPKEFDAGPAPLSVAIELVSTCNLRCKMCYTITEEFQNAVVGDQRMMPWNTVKAILDECAELGVPSVLMSWRGESLLYKQKGDDGKFYRFPDALKYARSKGILEVTSLTNGRLMTEDLAREIVEAEPNWINVSIDGLGEAYDKIRVQAAKSPVTVSPFEEVTGNIKRMIELRNAAGKKRPQLRTNTIYPAIANNPQAYHDFMESIGVGWVTVNEMLDFRGTDNECDDLPESVLIKDWACQYPFQRLAISANGIILPCTGSHYEDPPLIIGRYKGSKAKTVRNLDGTVATVDVPEMTLKEAWHSKKLNHIRDLHKQNRRMELRPGCSNCRYGAKSNGLEWVPKEWSMDKMDWTGDKWKAE